MTLSKTVLFFVAQKRPCKGPTLQLGQFQATTAVGGIVTDEMLVAEIQTGDRTSFRELVQRWQHKMFTFCYRQLGEESLAEEAAQDIFLKVFNNIQRFRGESKFSTWLYRIAHNHCINLQQRHHRRHRNMHDSIEDTTYLSAENHSPVDLIEELDFNTQLQRYLMQLPEEHRTLLILRDIQDCSYEEIVSITGLSLGTVKSRIHRARKALRPLLEQGELS